MCHSLNATVGNMFAKKGQKIEYPSEPIPITAAEVREKREREDRLKMERMKAAFAARAQQFNEKKRGDLIVHGDR